MLLYEFTEILTERAHDILFHVTKLRPTLSILQNEEFDLGFSLAKDYAEPFRPKNSEKYFYLSTARSPTSSFISVRRNSGDAQVLFEFNGDWFNRHGYTVKPVDYFGGGEGTSDEMEDRVFSKTPELSFKGSAKDLIKALHIKVPGSFVGDIAKQLLPVIKQCKTLSIPFYIYTDPTAWMMRRTDKAMPQSDVIKALKIELSMSNKYDKKDVFSKKYNDEGRHRYNVIYEGKTAYRALLNLIQARSPDDIKEETYNTIETMIPSAGDEFHAIKNLFFNVKYYLGKQAVANLVAAIKKSGMGPDRVWRKLGDKWIGLSYGLSKQFKQSPEKKKYNPGDPGEVDLPF